MVSFLRKKNKPFPDQHVIIIKINPLIHFIRTNSGNQDFIKLVADLDAYLSIIDGAEHPFYDQFNKIDNIRYAIVMYEDDNPVGCGAIKEYAHDTMEVKRMYVVPGKRGQGIGAAMLKQLELWAMELNFGKCLLETGIKQTSAIELYMKNGYSIIPNFGQYENISNSVCFEKILQE